VQLSLLFVVVVLGEALLWPVASEAGGANESALNLAIQQAQLTAGDGAAGDMFGSAVAISGNTAIVGSAVRDVAYVFVRSGASWTQQARLTASDGVAGDQFGQSVALSGDTAIIGAWYDDVGIRADQGSAYVFVRSGDTWRQQAKITASDGLANDYFGSSVAISGGTAVVGARYDDVGANIEQGSAYVFVRAGENWTEQTRLSPDDGASWDWFGCSVAIDGDTAVIGELGDDLKGNIERGSACVYQRSGSTWALQARLTADDGASAEYFGDSVAVAGDTALVGAYRHATAGNVGQGAAYVFTRAGSGWGQQAELTADDGASEDEFGVSVALASDVALVGSWHDDVGSSVDQGAAYLYTRSGKTWAQYDKLTAADASAWDWFGHAVALSGDAALVGAEGDEVGATNEQGSVYVFDGDLLPPSTAIALTPSANAAGWVNGPVTVTLSAVDAGGVDRTYYRLGTSGDFSVYDASSKLLIGDEGTTSLQFYSTDLRGHAETVQGATVSIDGVSPVTKAFAAKVKKGKKVKLGFLVSDAVPGSGQATVTLKILKGRKAVKTLAVSGAQPVNARQTYTWRCKLARGTYTVKVYAVDLAGNAQSKVGSAKLKVR
jgi:hypothetical protein